MKPILALLLSFGVMTAAFAQNGAQRDEARRVILGDTYGESDYPSDRNSRDVVLGGGNRTVYGNPYPQRYPAAATREQRIYEINRAYDNKINAVRYSRNFSRREKERIIRDIELNRRREIEVINTYYYQNSQRYNDCEQDTRRHEKRNGRGNHYGWERGANNPHGSY